MSVGGRVATYSFYSDGFCQISNTSSNLLSVSPSGSPSCNSYVGGGYYLGYATLSVTQNPYTNNPGNAIPVAWYPTSETCSNNLNVLGNPYHIDWFLESYCLQNSATCATSYTSCIGKYYASAGSISAGGQESCSTLGPSTPSKGCFSGSENVTLESGASKSISQVEVDDRILGADGNGNFYFSEVVILPHGENFDISNFSYIVTSKSREIKLTGDHLIFSGNCFTDAPYKLCRAALIRNGSCVQTIDGREEVVSNSWVSSYGLYTAVTTRVHCD